MKKINGISLLHGIAILSGIGIVGIFAWCDESINEGGRDITPTLLFVVYVLLLLACNAEIIASDENFKRVFDRTKKVYDIAKNNASVEGINLYNFEHDKKCKTVIFVTFGFLLVTLWLAIHFMLIRSLILALLISIGLSYMIITLVLVAWNLAAIRELNKTRMKWKVNIKDMITEFEKGQWSVIQNVITFMKDDQTAMELCKEAGFGKKRILELEKDSCTFMNEVKAFLKRQGHLLED